MILTRSVYTAFRLSDPASDPSASAAFQYLRAGRPGAEAAAAAALWGLPSCWVRVAQRQIQQSPIHKAPGSGLGLLCGWHMQPLRPSGPPCPRAHLAAIH